ncbi:putative single-strand binding protein [Lyophyllum shimeji]|uniref:Single-strand binding protein n=1 Tax=Lyophyllum shimeji TaxID=47721 RepID=A0A9P3PCX7_LYOSH|nr:putative single-strand binding protein [Lyophyllum shimeji]
MFCAIRAAASRSSVRSFSTSIPRASDVSKLILVGRLTKDPETRQTKNDREYVTYTVATANYPPPPPDANGERRPSASTFHRILSFQESTNRYLQNLKKGSKVYVEANFELREPEAGADPSTPQGQRQIFLRHETIRLLSRPKAVELEED